MGNTDSSPNYLKTGLWDLMWCSDTTCVSIVADVVKTTDLYVLNRANKEFVQEVLKITPHLCFVDGEYTFLHNDHLKLHPLGAYEYLLPATECNVETKGRVSVIDAEWYNEELSLFVASFPLFHPNNVEFIKTEVLKKIMETIHDTQRALFFINFDIHYYSKSNTEQTSKVTTLKSPSIFDTVVRGTEWVQSVLSDSPTTIWQTHPKCGVWDNILIFNLQKTKVEIRKQEKLISDHFPVDAVFSFNLSNVDEDDTDDSDHTDYQRTAEKSTEEQGMSSDSSESSL